MHKKNHQNWYSNAYLKIHWQKGDPGFPERNGIIEIWLRENQFRVRDATGRFIYEILSDIKSPFGLGHMPHTLEEVMDINKRIINATEKEVIEFWGDKVTDKGWILESGEELRPIAAREILPIAEQILIVAGEQQLKFVQTTMLFDRLCKEYRGEIRERDSSYKTQITQILSPPFILFNHARDTENEAFYLIHKVVDFQTGSVTFQQVEPPKFQESKNRG